MRRASVKISIGSLDVFGFEGISMKLYSISTWNATGVRGGHCRQIRIAQDVLRTTTRQIPFVGHFSASSLDARVAETLEDPTAFLPHSVERREVLHTL